MLFLWENLDAKTIKKNKIKELGEEEVAGVMCKKYPNFKACSTMTANTVITVQGQNCFVIGAHTFFEYQ